jgi:predicted alpha/beta-fold hydrolase
MANANKCIIWRKCNIAGMEAFRFEESASSFRRLEWVFFRHAVLQYLLKTVTQRFKQKKIISVKQSGIHA